MKNTQVMLLSFVSIISGLFGILLMYIAKNLSFCSWKVRHDCDYTSLEGWTIAGPGIFILLYSIYSLYKTIKEKRVSKISFIIFSITILCLIGYQLLLGGG